MKLVAELITETEALERYREEWDALAIAARRPYCAPAWMLAWWCHVPGPHAHLRTVVVLDDGHLVAVAPFFVERGRTGIAHYRLLGSGTSPRIEPLGRSGLEREAASVVASALSAARPRPAIVSFEGIPADSPWPDLLAEAWPGLRAPWRCRDVSLPAPTVSLAEGSFETWLNGKSRNFRQQSRSRRRKLDAKGARFHMTSTERELVGALEAFARLHYSRWEARGGSQALNRGVERMLLDAGRALLGDGRFRLWSIEVDGETISSHLFLAAGGEVIYWLGGFDDSWSNERPALQTLIAAIEDSFARSDKRLDLGAGGQDYKYRLADGSGQVDWLVLVPRGSRYCLARLALAPRQLKRILIRWLPRSLKQRRNASR